MEIGSEQPATRLHLSVLGVLLVALSMPPLALAEELQQKVSGADAELGWGTREASTRNMPVSRRQIFWEDRGDRLVISLPKERLATPLSSTERTGSPAYATAVELGVGLAAMSRQAISTTGTLTGNVTGRVLQAGRSLAGCRIRLLPVPVRGPVPPQVAHGESAEEIHSQALETTTGSDGAYLLEHVPTGEYYVAWLAPGSAYWQGWLPGQPDVAVKAGETTASDIEL